MFDTSWTVFRHEFDDQSKAPSVCTKLWQDHDIGLLCGAGFVSCPVCAGVHDFPLGGKARGIGGAGWPALYARGACGHLSMNRIRVNMGNVSQEAKDERRRVSIGHRVAVACERMCAVVSRHDRLSHCIIGRHMWSGRRLAVRKKCPRLHKDCYGSGGSAPKLDEVKKRAHTFFRIGSRDGLPPEHVVTRLWPCLAHFGTASGFKKTCFDLPPEDTRHHQTRTVKFTT